jgi:hypothetical protein
VHLIGVLTAADDPLAILFNTTLLRGVFIASGHVRPMVG